MAVFHIPLHGEAEPNQSQFTQVVAEARKVSFLILEGGVLNARCGYDESCPNAQRNCESEARRDACVHSERIEKFWKQSVFKSGNTAI